MAEVTWKATFIGAFLLFLIGVVVATCLNYAYASISSIKAGLAGPYTCHFDSQNNKSLLHKTVLCNSSANVETVQSCIYIYVSYTSDDGVTTENIKLSSTYKQTIPPPTTLLGTCSAYYCGTYRFKKLVNNTLEYKHHPDIVKQLEKAKITNNGDMECYLNPSEPQNGAYLYLNMKQLTKPDLRMFRWYEGWMVISAPLIIALAIIIYLFHLFFQGRINAANAPTTVKPKTSFEAPGLAPITSANDTYTNDEGGDASTKLV